MLQMEEPDPGRITAFVSGSWKDKDLVSEVIQYLWDRGIHITHDWTNDRDMLWSNIQVREAIKKAKYFVLVNGPDPTQGKAWECGLADAWEIPIIVLGEPITNSFYYRPVIHEKIDKNTDIGAVAADCIIAVDMFISLSGMNPGEALEYELVKKDPYTWNLKRMERAVANMTKAMLTINPEGGLLGDPDGFKDKKSPT